MLLAQVNSKIGQAIEANQFLTPAVTQVVAIGVAVILGLAVAIAFAKGWISFEDFHSQPQQPPYPPKDEPVTVRGSIDQRIEGLATEVVDLREARRRERDVSHAKGRLKEVVEEEVKQQG